MVPPGEIAAMRRAIAVSAAGFGATSPNPPVGCVILDAQGRVIAEGYHERKGEAHAEAQALAAAEPQAAGATAVVTLEPCNHRGRTPACRQALIDAKIGRVVVALLETFWRERGLTLVLVTHDSTIASRAQRLGVMDHGKMSIKQDTAMPPQAQ